MKKPEISIILCVYNGAAFLAETLDSILCQTFPDWECVLIDDCSQDATPEILADYARREPRIRLFRNERNRGLQYSLNRAVNQARGRYMVRIDADDICRRDRLERQFAFMEANPAIAVSCCQVFLWKDGKTVSAPICRRTDPDSVQALFLFFNPICHPGVIARLADIRAFMYTEGFSCSEDLKLWTEMLYAGKRFAVQDEYLLLYRLHDRQITATDPRDRDQYREIIQAFYTGVLFQPSPAELDFQVSGVYFRDTLDIDQLRRWLQKIRRENQTRGVFPGRALRYACLEILLEYRRAGVPAQKLTGALWGLGPLFTAWEMAARAARRRQDAAKRRQGAAVFGLRPVPGGKNGMVVYTR